MSNKQCKQCGQGFEITESDMEFYDRVSPVIGGEKYSVPAPNMCAECRRQRRFASRNERNLYHRKCDLTGKMIISNHSSESGMIVYDMEAWWSDKWDAKDYGRDFDFSQPFFAQFYELQKVVPQMNLSVWNSENSSYCNYIGNVRNSYLIFGSVYSEDCYYGSPYYSKNCLDTLVVRECELCYECTDCRKLYSCLYCQDCHGSNDLLYCFDLQGCSDCIGCAGLRNKKFNIFNKQYEESEYKALKKKYNLCDQEVHEELREKLLELRLKSPHLYMQSKQAQNVSGNYIYQCKNVFDSYYVDKSEDCSYCQQVVDLKDCQDNNFTEENELCYEYLGAYQNKCLLFSKFCNLTSESLYVDSCHNNSSNLFGCIGMRQSHYCILNKQYTKEEYEELVPRIIEHMKNTGEWGQYFPVEISPFAYNETVADEYANLTKEEVLAKGWRWKDDDSERMYKGPAINVPNNIEDVDEGICKEILKCEVTGKLYKIIPGELGFYKRMKLPIPKKCPDQRHRERLARRNPRKLWDRKCAKCGVSFKTTYSPDMPEIVYCEECYLKEVY